MGQLKYCTFLLAIVACTLATPTLHKSKGGTATVQHPPQAVYVPAPAPQPVQIVHPPPAKIVKPKPVFVKPVIVQPVLVVKPVVVASGGGGGHGHGGHHGKKHFLGKFK
ncbi:uncharacterized protein DDB_G0272720 [Scaptodrosophila lebanonensis]|uniref:Uncharacterized protein DDB_G0272720 n=1 Tax=Drosophila lebanonensis TaxID=7225 RepID=A0A6J2TRC0_DROLE|nr:uncharacterized protein DDB_G0272720 [Scaptodrosophila lebanonensis]